MKEAWRKFEQRIDALPLRGRLLVFAAGVIVLLYVVYFAIMEPQFARHRQLTSQIERDRGQANRLGTEVQRLTRMRNADPDAADRQRLADVRRQIESVRASMLDTQKDLVAPAQMVNLMEGLLKRNSRLRLRSLKTLPVTSLSEALEEGRAGERKPAAAGGSSTLAATSTDAIYKHSVEIVVEGSYLDMVEYLAQLETVPERLFWGRAVLNVERYPKASLTLTVFTLSLEKRWMGI
jgi:MSHA biogenesis protein MshJ